MIAVGVKGLVHRCIKIDYVIKGPQYSEISIGRDLPCHVQNVRTIERSTSIQGVPPEYKEQVVPP